MIIYGWGFFNRRNYSLIRKGCEACGYYGYHQSYESSRFATLYFIPVIPLGSQKITSECPNCKHSEGLSKGKWKRAQNKEVPALVRAYEAEPKNREAGEAALATAAHAHCRDAVRQLVPILRVNFPKDAEMEGLIASVYSFLCMDDEADEAFLAALDMNVGEDVAKESDLHMQVRDAVPPKPKNRLLQSLPVLIVPLILLYFFGSFLSDGLSSEVEDARLINGLSIPYQVNVNGKTYSIKPYGVVRLNNVEYGVNTIDPVAGDLEILPAQFEVSLPWHRRAFDAPYVVINPDRAAVVFDEMIEYTATNDGGNSYNADVGESYYVYSDVDYFFKDPPEEISLSSSSSRVKKTHVSYLNEYTELEIAQFLMGQAPEVAPLYLKWKLRLDPIAKDLIPYGSVLLDESTFKEITHEKLDDLPVAVDWHRYYQNASEDDNPSHDLVAEYQSRLARSPSDPALVYLLARVTQDQAEAVKLFLQCNDMAGADGYSPNALAYHYLLEGDTEKALAMSDVAIARDPDNIGFQSFRQSIIVASEDVARIRLRVKEEFDQNPYSLSGVYLQMLADYLDNSAADSVATITDYTKRLEKDNISDGEEIKQIKEGLLAYQHALMGDRAAYAKALASQGEPVSKVQGAILEARYSDALFMLATAVEGDYTYDYLTVYTLIKMQGAGELTDQALDELLELLRASGKEQRQWAAWLEQGTPPDLSALAHECVDPDKQFVVLAAFAAHYPEARDTYLRHAEKIKYLRGFNSLALSDLFTEH